ncbi:hypothetical protein DSO57_1011341 [Entomophthora muscae]|uniref:Uncharacterized protein n=1 Tax=Entomophthora muscae TaxID=34485 RepID=A0ACC2U4P7_9FUNG|nr:hypothetical protein DSO57_1011341 [Entomophthora muscae]
MPPVTNTQALLDELKSASSFYRNVDSQLSSDSLETLGSDDTLVASDPLLAAAKSVSLYKTEMCASFSSTGTCPYTTKCKFAHGLHELRAIPRHPKYKSIPCRNYKTGSCPYGNRCCFLHKSS